MSFGGRLEVCPVVSLFSGAGGLDLAAEGCAEAPRVQGPRTRILQVVVCVEWESDPAETIRANFDVPVLQDDIRTIPTRRMLRIGGLTKGEASLLIGGPPCTPFSKSGFWLDYKRESRDPDASLLDEYARVVEEARPEAFVLENVHGLVYRTHSSQLNRLMRRLHEIGYNPQMRLLNSAAYGVPQIRKRVFIVGRRDGKAFSFPPETHTGWTEHSRRIDATKPPYVTSREVLMDLLPGQPEEGEIVDGKFGEIAASIPPGHNYLWHTDRGGGEHLFKWRTRYWTFLLRLDPSRPASTIQASPGPYVGPFHWENVSDEKGRERVRRLRVPELLRLMTFPDGYTLVGSRRSIQRQLGNAVPVTLGKVVIRSLLEQLGYLEPTTETGPVQLEISTKQEGPAPLGR
jgi:DNA (cytosine-5)-methyltransferase 1